MAYHRFPKPKVASSSLAGTASRFDECSILHAAAVNETASRGLNGFEAVAVECGHRGQRVTAGDAASICRTARRLSVKAVES
jgi:hypothetical protein